MTCREFIVDLDSRYPSETGRKVPSSTRRVWLYWDAVDCDGAGVSLVNSTWAIHPDDDDTTLTLTSPSFAGFAATVLVSGGTDGSSYRLINTVTTTDGRIIPATVVQPVFETCALAA